MELNFTASVIAALLSSLTSLPDDEFDATLLEGIQSIIDALRHACPTGCDAGIAHAVTALCRSSKQPAVRRRLVLILGLSDDCEEMNASDEAGKDLVQEISSVPLLPPRVALEHADTSTRLNAIERLMKEPTSADSEGGETLEEALLRHFLSEDELNVTVAAGSALAVLLESRTSHVSLRFANDCLKALRQWTLDENSFIAGGISTEKSAEKRDKRKLKRTDSGGKEITTTAFLDERVRLLELALEIAGYTVRSLLATDRVQGIDDFDIVQEQLIQGIIAHLDLLLIAEKEKKGARGDQIVRALFHAIGDFKERKATIENVTTVLLTTKHLLDGLRSFWTGPDIRRHCNLSSDFVLVRRYFNVYLTVLSDRLDELGNSQLSDELMGIVSDALSACLFIVGWKGESGSTVVFDKKESKSLVRCLGACAKHVQTFEASMLLNAVVDLSSVPSQQTYNEVCLTSINVLCDEYAAVHGVSTLIILMEAALRPGVSGLAILRLLALASTFVSSDQQAPISDIIIFVLALFGHSDQKIRKAALQLTSVLKDAIITSQLGSIPENDKVVLDFISYLGTDGSNVSSAISSIILDGPSTLPVFLGESILRSKDARKLRIEVLRHCHLTACSTYSSNHTTEVEKRWLSFQDGTGGCRAAALVLSVLELAGETAFPLMDRYEYAGRGILAALLEKCNDICHREVTAAVVNLIHSIARMMKGVMVIDASCLESEISAMIISTGPNARGTRARSYSMGRSVGLSFVDPYPKDMYNDILKCLSFRDAGEARTAAAREMCRAVMNEVLGSQSWGEGVFRKMDRGSRRQLLSSLLYLHMTGVFDCTGEVILGLSADGTDVAHLIRGEWAEKSKLASFIFISDYIHIHAERLSNGPGYSELVSLLFQTLEMVSSNEYLVDDVDEVEFARQCLLNGLAGLVSSNATSNMDERRHKFPKKHLARYASLLSALVSGADSRSEHLRALPLGRARVLAFSILTSLCSVDPSSIVASLVPTMLASITVSDNHVAPRLCNRYEAPRDVFLSLVPVFAKYSNAADLSLFDLFVQFLSKCAKVKDEKDKMELYSCMVDAIMAIPQKDFNDTASIGSFIAAFLAFNLRNNGPIVPKKAPSSTLVATDILRLAPAITQVATLIQLIGYTNGFLLKVLGANDGEYRKVSTDCNTIDLENSVLFNSASTTEIRDRPDPYILNIAVSILMVALSVLQDSSVTNLLRKSDGMESKLSLRLWHDLLILQSTSLQAHGRDLQKLTRKGNIANSDIEANDSETHFWDECRSLIDTSLELVQTLLPAHLFLSSVASLIRHSADLNLCSRAIRFVSDRATEIKADSPESSMFLDLLPMLVELLDSSSGAPEHAVPESTILVQQSVLLAVETLARSFCLQATEDISGRLTSFNAVLKHTSLLIKAHSAPFERQGKIISTDDSTSCQILCNAALSASTLVRVLKVRSLPLLINLIEPLLSVFSSVNDALLRNPSQRSATKESQAVLIQLSILRVLIAIADSLPQFLGPYLGRLLSPSALLSLSLRSESSEHQLAVKSSTAQLEVVLSQKIPVRQLVPSLCKMVPACKRSGEVQTLLAMLKESVKQAPRSELPSLQSCIVKALTLAYEFRGSCDEESVDLMDGANGVLLAMVMKLSESELRPLYAKLREWRGDVVSEGDVALKRWAFWSLSAILSTELRGIFLPCLGTVLSDSVDDLVSKIVLDLALLHLLSRLRDYHQ